MLCTNQVVQDGRRHAASLAAEAAAGAGAATQTQHGDGDGPRASVACAQDWIDDKGGDVFAPALGPAWHHCVSTRLTMHRAKAGPGGRVPGLVGYAGVEPDADVGVLRLTKCPSAGFVQLAFGIGPDGVRPL